MTMTSLTLSTRVALAFAALTTTSTLARADQEPDPQHGVSLTFSPIHLALPMLELQAEFKLSPTLGVAAIGGLGSVSIDSSDGTSASAFVFELGAKLAWYAAGDFEEGLQLGLEVLYLGVSGEDDLGDNSFFGSGLSIGPFIGYKLIADVGFTFEAQVGPALIIASAEDEDGGSASTTGLGPLVNLNVGWSF